MYELKRIGKNWLLRRVGGRFVRLSILKDATDVQISDNCIIADDAIYEIVENNDGIYIVEVKDVSTKTDTSPSEVPQLKQQKQKRHCNSYEIQTVKCSSLNDEKDLKTMTSNISDETEVPNVTTKFDRSQSEAPQIKQQKPKRHCYENVAIECSSLNEEKDLKTLTHPFSDETELDFKETKMKLEMLNKSSPKHEASLDLGSEELAEDLKSLTTGSDELIEYAQSLEAGSDMVTENEKILDTETNILTSKNYVSERYEDAYNAVEDDVPLPPDHTFVVDVKPSDLAKVCGVEGTFICSIDNRSLTFRDSITDEVIYCFSFPWMRRWKRYGQCFSFEIGRKCPYGPGTIEFRSKHARAIDDFITKITHSKKTALEISHSDFGQQ